MIMRRGKTATALSFVCFLVFQSQGSAHGPHEGHGDKPHTHKFGNLEDMQDEDHIKLHLNDTIDLNITMDKEHSHFYYFNMHNLNGDSYIDGLEIAKGLTHSHDGEPFTPMADEELELMVDAIMADFDADGNGLVDYSEYSASLNKKLFTLRLLFTNNSTEQKIERCCPNASFHDRFLLEFAVITRCE